jgi:hypothetical protein
VSDDDINIDNKYFDSEQAGQKNIIPIRFQTGQKKRRKKERKKRCAQGFSAFDTKQLAK